MGKGFYLSFLPSLVCRWILSVLLNLYAFPVSLCYIDVVLCECYVKFDTLVVDTLQ